jgi:hypothetical protein
MRVQIHPGDIGLTANPQRLGRYINFAQYLEEGDESIFGHALIFTRARGVGVYMSDGSYIESVHKISRGHIDSYAGKRVKIIRHKFMTPEAYEKGHVEVLDNLGQTYPYLRLGLHGVDSLRGWFYRKVFKKKAPWKYSRMTKADWPVCSELAAQQIHFSGLEGGWGNKGTLLYNGWSGVNPDNLDDVSINRKDLYDTIEDITWEVGHGGEIYQN